MDSALQFENLSIAGYVFSHNVSVHQEFVNATYLELCLRVG